MTNKKDVRKLAQNLADSIDKEKILQLTDPCTRVSIRLIISRGQLSVRIESVCEIVKAMPKSLVVNEALTADDWKRIFSLNAFSTKPERHSDLHCRELLLEIKEKGFIEYYGRGGRFQRIINEILEGKNLPYRLTTADGGGHAGCTMSKIF